MIAGAHGKRMPCAKRLPCASPCTMGGRVPPLLGCAKRAPLKERRCMIADVHGKRMPCAKHLSCAFPCTMGGHVPPLLETRPPLLIHPNNRCTHGASCNEYNPLTNFAFTGFLRM